MRDRTRVAVSAAFLLFGVTVGGLIPRMPALKESLHLTDGQVGLALLGASLGGIAGSLASRLVIRHHARLSLRLAMLLLCAASIGPGLAPNLDLLVASLFAVGFMWAFIDVLDNALGAELERTRRTHLINGFHGFWSLGAFAGSLIAGAAAALAVAPLPQFVFTAVIVAAVSLWSMRGLPNLSQPNAPARKARISLTAAVGALAALSFAAVIAEGGTSDWSALFLRELSHVTPGLAAAGFSGFSVAAMLVRFRADILTARVGRTTVTRIGAATAVCGLTLAIALPAPPTAILGFTLVGMGTAVVLPLAFVVGANLGGTGTSLALVMASTYAGTIAGPPLIGAVAGTFGLRVAMAIPLLAAVVVLALAGSLTGGWTGSASEAEPAV